MTGASLSLAGDFDIRDSEEDLRQDIESTNASVTHGDDADEITDYTLSHNSDAWATSCVYAGTAEGRIQDWMPGLHLFRSSRCLRLSHCNFPFRNLKVLPDRICHCKYHSSIYLHHHEP